MNDDTMMNQNPSSSSADEAQKELANGQHYSGGSAMLDAQIEASNHSLDDAPGENPIATNINDNTALDDPSDAKLFTTSGAYPPQQSEMEKDYRMSAIASEQDEPNPEIAAENTNLNLESGAK